MPRRTISIPADLHERLDEYRPEDMSWPAFVREVVLPALEGDAVEIMVDGELSSDVVDRLETIEGKIDDTRSQLPAATAQELEDSLRR
jgi:hypothetical protein